MLIRKQHALNFYFACILTANAVLGTNTGDSLDYPQLKLVRNAKEWIGCCSNEIGCLARDVYPRMMTGLNTIHFIHLSQIPANRTVTYLRIVTNYRPQKENSYRIRFTTPNLLKDFSYHTRVHTRSNSQHYPLPQLSFCLILLYIRYRSRSFISLSSSHTTLPTRRLQIQSIHILSVVLSCATT